MASQIIFNSKILALNTLITKEKKSSVNLRSQLPLPSKLDKIKVTKGHSFPILIRDTEIKL